MQSVLQHQEKRGYIWTKFFTVNYLLLYYYAVIFHLEYTVSSFLFQKEQKSTLQAACVESYHIYASKE